MELRMPSSWRSHLLLVIVFLSMRLLHAQSSTLGLWHAYQNGSRMLPKDCDRLCAARLRVEGLFASKRESARGRAVTPVRPHNKSELSVIAGTFKGETFGENFVAAIFGQQRLDLLFDTNTALVWGQGFCDRDSSCYSSKADIYYSANPRWLQKDTDAEFCASLEASPYGLGTESGCGFQFIVSSDPHTVESWTTGYAIRERLSVLDSSETNPHGAVDLGEVVLFIGVRGHTPFAGKMAGVFGVLNEGRGLNFMQQYNWERLRRSKSYSFCLPSFSSSKPGELELGLINIPFTYPAAALRPAGSKNSVEIYGILVGGTRVDIRRDLRRARIDTGSPFTKLHKEVYAAVRDAWRKAVIDAGISDWPERYKDLDTCYPDPDGRIITIASITLRLGGGVFPGDFTIGSSGNTIYFPFEGKWYVCFAYVETEEGNPDPFVIGAIQLQGTQVTFDLRRSQMSWKHGYC